MLKKVSELEGVALDWAVAKCQGYFSFEGQDPTYWESTSGAKHFLKMREGGVHWTCSSTSWSEGGPIIDKEKIDLQHSRDSDTWWAQSIGADEIGPTALVAAMRCYVASKLGEEVEVPDEL